MLTCWIFWLRRFFFCIGQGWQGNRTSIACAHILAREGKCKKSHINNRNTHHKQHCHEKVNNYFKFVDRLWFVSLTLIKCESSSHIGQWRFKSLGSTTCSTNQVSKKEFPLVNGERFIVFSMPVLRLGLHKLNITLRLHTPDCDGEINKDTPDNIVLHILKYVM